MSVLKYVNYCGLNVIGCCFKNRRGFIPGPAPSSSSKNELSNEPLVSLDTSNMGKLRMLLRNSHFKSECNCVVGQACLPVFVFKFCLCLSSVLTV